jgi:hypothetical protein
MEVVGVDGIAVSVVSVGNGKPVDCKRQKKCRANEV